MAWLTMGAVTETISVDTVVLAQTGIAIFILLTIAIKHQWDKEKKG